jgi:hypothetical protein
MADDGRDDDLLEYSIIKLSRSVPEGRLENNLTD